MKLACPWCQVPVPAGQVDLATGLARCRSCGTVFRFDSAVELAAAGPRWPRPLTEQPRSVTVREDGGGLVVTYRWFWWKYVALAVFCVAWDAGIASWYV